MKGTIYLIRFRAQAFNAVVAAAAVICPGTALAWDPVRDLTGQNLTNIVQGRVANLGRATSDFIRNPLGYVLHLPISTLSDICSAPAQHYEGMLRGNANGNWRSLPQPLLQVMQPYYAVDLERVRYATVSILPGGYAMTFGNTIYFPEFLDFSTYKDVRWMAHELEHVVQYARSRSDAQQVCEYMLHSVGAGLQHDDINMERAANRKADYVAPIAYPIVSSGVSYGSTDTPYSPAPPRIFWDEPPNSIWIANETDQTVYFSLRTQTFQGWGSIEMPPHSGQVFYGAQGDRDFQIYVGMRDGRFIQYVIPTQTKQHISWNAHGLLDVFYE